ncbi:putative DNA-directed RNA polymerases I and III subunit RPAC2 [Triangularia setosa]|uniref:DNA-directed RNA polymerases I and III subunit RPAC2 n=1 Tax=Triangularia setosa TaxID=2587417 RepID=A0AAN7A6K0_9PEZI|nr:putative DNA-directed RNA polymerases I and III subunit RPAC2 [Podospora setosa]
MAARPESEDIAMDDAPTSHQPEVKDDTMVDDEGEDVDENEDDEEEEEEETQRVKLLPGSTETAASFEFANEGHTLGNALRYVIMRNPDVEFCAYAIPHPSEAKMNVRIQTFEGTTAIEALEKGLRDIQELCDVVTDKFVAAAADFAQKKAVTA